jgi:O-antigen/teichoic acid export membrane protein
MDIIDQIFQQSAIIVVLQAGTAILEAGGLWYLGFSTSTSTIGQYALFMGSIVFLSLAHDVGLQEATAKRISEGIDPAEHIGASLLLRISLLTVLLIVVYILSETISSYIGYSDVTPLLMAGLFLTAGRNFVKSILIGEKKVGYATFINFLSSAAKVVIWIVLLSYTSDIFAVILGYLIGELLATLSGINFIQKRLAKPSHEHFQSVISFSKYSWIEPMKNSLWVRTDTLILGLFVSSSQIGIYEIAWRTTGVLFFVASALSGALFPHVSNLSKNNKYQEIGQIIQTGIQYAGIVAIPGLIGGAIFGEWLLGLFGSEYTPGYLVFLVLLFARLFHSYETVMMKCLNGLDLPDFSFRVNLVFLVLNIIGNISLVYWIGWIGAAVATTISMLVAATLSFYYLRSLASFSIPIRELFNQIAASLIMALVILSIASFSTKSVYNGLLIMVGVGIYTISLLSLSKTIRSQVKAFINA